MADGGQISADPKLLDAALAASGVGIICLGEAGHLTMDRRAAALLGIDGGTLRSLLRMIDRRDRKALLAAARAADGGQGTAPLCVQMTGACATAWLRVHMQRPSQPATVWHWIATICDATAECEHVEALKRSEAHLRHTVELSPQIPWTSDPQGKLIDVSSRWAELTGLSREESLGDGWFSAVHPDDVQLIRQAAADSIATVRPFDVRLRVTTRGQGYRWMRAFASAFRDDEGNVVRWYGYTEDVHEHVLAQQKMRWTAEHDPLTGLPNRAMFNRQLESALEDAKAGDGQIGILILDMDQFKDVNDLHGHDVGDAMLCGFAEKLHAALPGSAMIARIGGDEFAVLLPDLASREEVTSHCNTLFKALLEPFRFGDQAAECRTSIGAAIYPEHGSRWPELMKQADLALYAAKTGGRGRLAIFDPSMQDQMRRRVAMVRRARSAVEGAAIIPYYQPKIALMTGEIIGFEALLRWRDRKGRLYTPASISAAFNDLDIAEALGIAMMERVFDDMMSWRALGLPFGHVSINASSAEFRRDMLAQRVIERLDRTGVSPREVQIEVTEDVFLGRGSEQVEAAIRQLHGIGVKIGIDDFGTGYASLSHLRQFPVDTLKIDRSFVANAPHLADEAAIVGAILGLGRTLGMAVVAEGIETPGQAAALVAQGCQYGQGYLFCRPAPASDIPTLLNDWDPFECRQRMDLERPPVTWLQPRAS